MSQAYTPGLQIKPRARYRATRTLPVAGQVLVRMGERVRADQVVARTQQPGNIHPINLANQLSISPGDVPGAMQLRVGDAVEQEDLLAISKGMFGLFRQSFHAPASGTIESVSEVTGQVILRGAPQPLEVTAFVAGEVTEVIPGSGVVVETPAAFLQGIFGIGGERLGTLRVVGRGPSDDLTADLLKPEHQGCVVVGGRKIHGRAFDKARELGVAALIAGGIDDASLKEILGYDLGVAVTGSEKLGLTVIITEGFGEIAMAERTFQLLRSLEGQAASVNGATQIRAGVLRPEIVVPLPESTTVEETAARVGGGVLEVGSAVRLIRDPYFGELGTVTALPHEPQALASGSKARVLEVRCRSGKNVLVPRANVEIVDR